MYFLPEPIHGYQIYTDKLETCIVSCWNEIFLRKYRLNELVSPYSNENKEMLFCSLKLAAYNFTKYTFEEFYTDILQIEITNKVRTIVTELPFGVKPNPKDAFMKGKKLHEVIRGLLCIFGGKIRAALMEVWSHYKDNCSQAQSENIPRLTDVLMEEKVRTLRDKHRDEILQILTDTFVDPYDVPFSLLPMSNQSFVDDLFSSDDEGY